MRAKNNQRHTGLLAVFALAAVVVWGALAGHEARAQQEQQASEQQTSEQQSDMIRGQVLETSGTPVVGAVVRVIGTERAPDTTNREGRFAVEGKVGERLRVSMSTARSGVGGEPASRIVMVTQLELSITLDDYKGIPVGYQTSRSRAELTGAVGHVDHSELEDQSPISTGKALYGQIPGLTALGNGGLPPTFVNMYVRGRGTSSNSSPLVLVDGFERPLSSLASGEVESVSVLKDAAALAKYGQRGANGAVLITTKRGTTEDRLHVTASTEISATRPTGLPSFADAPTYARALREAQANDGVPQFYTEADVDAFESGGYPSSVYPDVNWMDEVLRDTGYRSNTEVTFQGGGETARFFTLMNYVTDAGILNQSNATGRSQGLSTQAKYSRFNFRTNLDVDITDHMLLRTNLTGRLTERNRAEGAGFNARDLFGELYSVPSAAYPATMPGGMYGGSQQFGSNPVALLTGTGAQFPNAREFELSTHLRRDMSDVLPGLGVEVAGSYNNYGEFIEKQKRSYAFASVNRVRNAQGVVIDTTVSRFGQDTDLRFRDRFRNSRQYYDLQGTVDYARPIGDKYRLETMALFHQASRSFDGQNNTFHYRNAVANAHLGISGKYFLQATASYSGTNALPSGNRYGLFPAVSAGWLVSEEGFMAGASFVDFLKLRASWGMVGNGDLPLDRPYEQQFSSGAGGRYWFGNDNSRYGGFGEDRLAATDYTHEISYKHNVGIDATLFGQLDVTADVFYNRRTNILTGTGGNVSGVVGQTAPREAVGVVDNRGVETGLTWRGEVGDFGYHLGGQFSLAKNEIVDQAEGFRPEDYLRRTGEQVGQQFGLEAIGFFEDEQDIANSPDHNFSNVQPGDIKYKDQNGDGVINNFDQVPIGHASGYPEMYFSATLGASYKGLSVTALVQGTGNQTAYLNTQGVFRPLQNGRTISDYYYENRWTPENSDSATLPRLTTQSNNNNFQPNSVWLQDRSYVKLRLLEVSYSLPASLTKPLQMESARLVVKGRNLFSIDDIPEVDPEQLSAQYPILRSYSLGFKVGF